MHPARIHLARLPTPLEPMDRLSAQLGGPRLWIKRDDLTESGASGNKIRKLEYCFAEAKAQGCNQIITCGGLQSNHCRATALLGARLGFKVVLVLRGEPEGAAQGNLLLDTVAGAEIRTYPIKQYQHSLDQLLSQAKQDGVRAGYTPYVIPTGASDEVGVWGYVAASAELVQDFATADINPDALVVATGSGGTQAGLTAGLPMAGSSLPVWGFAVCDDAAWFRDKVRSDLQAWQKRYRVDLDIDALRINVDDRYIGPGYARATPAVFETIALVARTEGLVLDPVYTGKAFHGLLQECREGRFKQAANVVFVHTGGSYGLMAQSVETAAALSGSVTV